MLEPSNTIHLHMRLSRTRAQMSALVALQVFAYDLRRPDVVLSESIHSYAFNDDEVNQVKLL